MIGMTTLLLTSCAPMSHILVFLLPWFELLGNLIRSRDSETRNSHLPEVSLR
jgi:hypothetical protein